MDIDKEKTVVLEISWFLIIDGSFPRGYSNSNDCDYDCIRDGSSVSDGDYRFSIFRDAADGEITRSKVVGVIFPLNGNPRDETATSNTKIGFSILRIASGRLECLVR